MKIGVIKRGKYGSRLIDTLKNHSPFDVVSIEVQEDLPSFIDYPEDYIDKDLGFFRDSDLIISFALHIDLDLYIAKLCAKNNTELLIPGEENVWHSERSALVKELKKTGVTFAFPRIMCMLGEKSSPVLGEYSKLFGIPIFKCKIENGRIVSCKAIKSAPCGASYFVAKNILGCSVEEAPQQAALFAQYYPCRAPRGYNYVANEVEGIHLAGEVHKKAMEDAIKDEKR
ncbi:DUF166 domain-containing protein [Candidatus Methanoliparum sp. LAM-1]|uniref:DUF166 domain-containing protein n=1 Tax=Candidatus Methanoliparum sp. LAM-1 TaxID=2874846 RepID=UPI001E462427|nr:DUF166 domain-containing protein [Candidatus Methanoliparum sp. LAM-1]BDC35860.1 hypothetical protein MTLP_05420 [Candidatus Methanoliparum sp. LAM-1]